MVMNYDALESRYPSRRGLVYGKKGMVCTSQPQAAQAGLDILKKGGNAVDAALAAAACLTVVEPCSNGIGGDCFALVWKEGRLYGLNGSGPSPALLKADRLWQAGLTEIPEKGWIPVTVPGVPAAWACLNERFGALSLREDLQPAVDCAGEGFPVTPVIAHAWRQAGRAMMPLRGKEEFQEWFRVFTDDGRTPEAGELWRLPDHARTLEAIGESRAEEFYRGCLADAMDAFSRRTGGLLRKEDLLSYAPQWVEPVSVTSKGYDIWELPPNGNGVVVLAALNILEQLKIKGHEDPEGIHRQLEAMKLAFADGQQFLADPRRMRLPVDALLNKSYAKERAGQIRERAMLPEHGNPYCGGTVYLCTADESGMMVSFIQSGYDDFGSGLVVPGTGINLQDRGCGFSLDPESPNFLEPGKRPYHTIIPGFLGKDGAALGPFGVMGAMMQPQGHVQVLMNLIDFGMNPQDALNAPRWQWKGERKVELEAGFGPEVLCSLRKRGHEVLVPENSWSMGRGQMILRQENGVYVGATEPRADGCALPW